MNTTTRPAMTANAAAVATRTEETIMKTLRRFCRAIINELQMNEVAIAAAIVGLVFALATVLVGRN